MITCETCGELLPDGTQFCSRCGAHVGNPAPTEPIEVPMDPTCKATIPHTVSSKPISSQFISSPHRLRSRLIRIRMRKAPDSNSKPMDSMDSSPTIRSQTKRTARQ